MTIEELRQSLPDYARDTKLNLAKVLSAEGAPGLSPTQIKEVALASAYATKNATVIGAVEGAAVDLSEAEGRAAKAAAAIMAMNNIYYRFTHLVSDKDYQRLPANLRMNVIGNSGVAKRDFELMSLAVSAINGCGLCIDAHVHELVKERATKEAVQSAVRIAAVLASAAQVLAIEETAVGVALAAQ